MSPETLLPVRLPGTSSIFKPEDPPRHFPSTAARHRGDPPRFSGAPASPDVF